MERVEFRNSAGRLLGWTQRNATTKQQYGYRAQGGRRVGIYFEETNVTFRTNGQRYGMGNQLSALITEREC